MIQRSCIVVLGLSLLISFGCAIRPQPDLTGDPFPGQIGAPRPIDPAEMDAYERIIAQIMYHIEDGVLVLSCVDDAESARRAAGMFVEASDRVVMLRRQMLEANPRDKIPASIIVGYGPRYFLARFETERQLKRIKALDETVHQPLRDVLTRLDKRVDRVEDTFEEAEKLGGKGGL